MYKRNTLHVLKLPDFFYHMIFVTEHITLYVSSLSSSSLDRVFFISLSILFISCSILLFFH
ncbi:hypothetical protein CW304_19120 [Bacillus sp. UFRGS-B20]|nr:hypothetical protein CW304_19120 [Bacillus sp. UFRGS-B20]